MEQMSRWTFHDVSKIFQVPLWWWVHYQAGQVSTPVILCEDPWGKTAGSPCGFLLTVAIHNQTLDVIAGLQHCDLEILQGSDGRDSNRPFWLRSQKWRSRALKSWPHTTGYRLGVQHHSKSSPTTFSPPWTRYNIWGYLCLFLHPQWRSSEDKQIDNIIIYR